MEAIKGRYGERRSARRNLKKKKEFVEWMI